MANSRDDDRQKTDEMTPLQRYLAKQKAEGGTGAPEPRGGKAAAAASDAAPHASLGKPPGRYSEEKSAGPAASDDASAPFWKSRASLGGQASDESAPRPAPASAPKTEGDTQPSPPLLNLNAGTLIPAPFFQRALAFFIDLLIVSKIASLLSLDSITGFYLSSSVTEIFYSPLHFFIFQAVTFVYFGWFYREKGATPGKMIFGLEVSTDAAMNGDVRLSYVRTYLRESIGKAISACLLMLGYFLALFRADHRALHDLLFETRVMKRKKTQLESKLS